MPDFLIGLITTLHVVVCIGLMAAILLQSGKGGGLAGTFGAGSSQTLFGGRGAATFLSRATTALAVTFFLTSLTLGVNASRAGGSARRSLIQEDARRRSQQGEGAGVPSNGAPQGPGPGSSPVPVPSGPQAPTTAGAPGPSPAGQAPPVQSPVPPTSAPATGGK
jgi:preprotein translocase subunit SecG